MRLRICRVSGRSIDLDDEWTLGAAVRLPGERQSDLTIKSQPVRVTGSSPTPAERRQTVSFGIRLQYTDRSNEQPLQRLANRD